MIEVCGDHLSAAAEPPGSIYDYLYTRTGRADRPFLYDEALAANAFDGEGQLDRLRRRPQVVVDAEVGQAQGRRAEKA